MTANNAVHSSTPSLLKNLGRTDHGRTEKKHEAAAAEEHQVGGHGEWEGTLQAYNEAKNDPL